MKTEKHRSDIMAGGLSITFTKENSSLMLSHTEYDLINNPKSQVYTDGLSVTFKEKANSLTLSHRELDMVFN